MPPSSTADDRSTDLTVLHRPGSLDGALPAAFERLYPQVVDENERDRFFCVLCYPAKESADVHGSVPVDTRDEPVTEPETPGKSTYIRNRFSTTNRFPKISAEFTGTNPPIREYNFREPLPRCSGSNALLRQASEISGTVTEEVNGKYVSVSCSETHQSRSAVAGSFAAADGSVITAGPRTPPKRPGPTKPAAGMSPVAAGDPETGGGHTGCAAAAITGDPTAGSRRYNSTVNSRFAGLDCPWTRSGLYGRSSHWRPSKSMCAMRCASEETVTTRLVTRSSSRFVSAKCPRWWTPNWSSKPSVVCRNESVIVPALLTRMSTALSIPAAKSRIDSSEARSSGRTSTAPLISAAAAWPLSWSLTARMSRAPLATSAAAAARPIPLSAPVMIMVRPVWSGIHAGEAGMRTKPMYPPTLQQRFATKETSNCRCVSGHHLGVTSLCYAATSGGAAILLFESPQFVEGFTLPSQPVTLVRQYILAVEASVRTTL